MKNVFILSLLVIIFMSCKKDIKNVHKNFQTEDDEEWVLTNYELVNRVGERFNGFGTHIKEFKFELPRLASSAKSGPILSFKNGPKFNSNYQSKFHYLQDSEKLHYDIQFIVDDNKGANYDRSMYISISKDTIVEGKLQNMDFFDDLYSLTRITKNELHFISFSSGTYINEYFYFEKRKK